MSNKQREANINEVLAQILHKPLSNLEKQQSVFKV